MPRTLPAKVFLAARGQITQVILEVKAELPEWRDPRENIGEVEANRMADLLVMGYHAIGPLKIKVETKILSKCLLT